LFKTQKGDHLFRTQSSFDPSIRWFGMRMVVGIIVAEHVRKDTPAQLLVKAS
jgi:hypothetical protein